MFRELAMRQARRQGLLIGRSDGAEACCDAAGKTEAKRHTLLELRDDYLHGEAFQSYAYPDGRPHPYIERLEAIRRSRAVYAEAVAEIRAKRGRYIDPFLEDAAACTAVTLAGLDPCVCRRWKRTED